MILMTERKNGGEDAGGNRKALIVKAGLLVAGTAVAGRGAQLTYRHYAMPAELQDKRVNTYKKGAIILTAGALALEEGDPLTIARIREWTELNRHNASLGVNFLQEKGLADRQIGHGHEVDQIRATMPLLEAAKAPEEYPFLRGAMQWLAQQL